MFDLAREQTVGPDQLMELARLSQDSGYDSLGLYLEHRFAYPSVPWAHGLYALTPESVLRVRSEFPSLKIVPFLNVLGHMEGFLRCEPGESLRESSFGGMMGCPSRLDFRKLTKSLVDDIIQCFDSEIIHLGGDEAWELSNCPVCAQTDKPEIYSRHMTPLIEQVLSASRQPAVWGDMFIEHPEILAEIPKQTLVFDWQYRTGLSNSAPSLAAHGHALVGCPTLHVYDAMWVHLKESETNVRQVAFDVKSMNLEGTCLTTWECGLFGAYDTLFPAIEWASNVMDNPSWGTRLVDAYSDHREFAELMGIELNSLGGQFSFDGHRNRLKCRLLAYGNPFLAWKHHGEELAGEAGDKALELSQRAIDCSTGEEFKGVAIFVRTSVEIVRMMEAAKRWYAEGEPDKAVRALSPIRHAFDTLETVARRTRARIGGSLADIERCGLAKRHVETVIHRIRQYGRGELGYVPSFDTLVQTVFVPYDQGCWHRVNKWGCD